MMPPTPTDAASDAYIDTVALLQEEIARLEAELRLQDERASGAVPDPLGAPGDEGVRGRIEELTGLLVERDETIGLLWDQLAAMEEVESARSAEWEQLSRWVQELEDRIGGEGNSAADPDEGRRESEALREELRSRQDAWEAERGRLVQEVAGLRGRLDEAAGLAGDRALADLEGENRRLRDECRRLAALEPAAAEADKLREHLRGVLAELGRSHERLDRAEENLRRERVEREAERATLCARQATERLIEDGTICPDERIRALREHLREVHEREQKEREEHQLSHRLSRLWRRSSSRR